MSPFGAIFFHEGAGIDVFRRQPVRTEVFAVSVTVQVQHYPMFARSVEAVRVALEGGPVERLSSRGSSSLATMTRTVQSARESTASRRSISTVSIRSRR